MNPQEIRQDALTEFLTVGGGQVATSLSQMTQKRVTMKVPDVSIASYELLYEQTFHEEEIVYALSCPVVGAIEGICLLVLTEQAVEQLTDWLLVGFTKKDAALKQSALDELMNIVSNSFVAALAQLLDIKLNSQLPRTVHDYFGAIMSSIYLACGQYDDQILCMKNEFHYEGTKLDTSLFFIPEPNALATVFQALGL